MSKLNAYLTGLLFVAGVGLCSPSVAQQPTNTTINVQGLASTCFNCHGTDGRSSHSGMASIAGKPVIQLREQLQAFSSGQPPAYTTVMDRLVQGLSTEEITALAQYFSQLPAQQPKEKK